MRGIISKVAWTGGWIMFHGIYIKLKGFWQRSSDWNVWLGDKLSSLRSKLAGISGKVLLLVLSIKSLASFIERDPLPGLWEPSLLIWAADGHFITVHCTSQPQQLSQDIIKSEIDIQPRSRGPGLMCWRVMHISTSCSRHRDVIAFFSPFLLLKSIKLRY